MYNGITISNLLKKLRITKQSLNRVLNDLIKNEYIFFKKGKKDTRLKHIYLSSTGEKIFNEIFSVQKKRIYKALLNSSSNEVQHFDNVIKKIINEKI
jgi:DNA-binding MarR family transcriptional regulator